MNGLIMAKITQTKKSFFEKLQSLPEYVHAIKSVKKYLKKPSKNPRKSTIQKIKNDIRKEQYRIVKNELITNENTKDRDKRANTVIAEKLRSYSPEKFENYLIAREALQPNESLYIVKKYNDLQRVNYLTLRYNGVSQMQAIDMIEKEKASTEKIMRIAKKTLDIAKTLAKGNAVELENILKGVRRSDKTTDDWEVYVKMRQKQNWRPVRLDLKTGRYIKLEKDSEEYHEYEQREKDGYYR